MPACVYNDVGVGWGGSVHGSMTLFCSCSVSKSSCIIILILSSLPASPKRCTHTSGPPRGWAVFALTVDAEWTFPREKDSAHYWNIDMRYGMNRWINIFLRQMKAEWKLGNGWEAEGHLSQAAKPMWTTSSSGLSFPTLLPFLPLEFCCPPAAHVTGLFVSFGFDPCLPYFRVGFIKCLSGSFRALSLSLFWGTH